MARGLHGLKGLGAECVFLPGMVVPPSKDGLPLLSVTVWRFQAFGNSIRYKQAKIRVSSRGRTILYQHSRTSLDFSGKQCESAVGLPRPKREFQKNSSQSFTDSFVVFWSTAFHSRSLCSDDRPDYAQKRSALFHRECFRRLNGGPFGEWRLMSLTRYSWDQHQKSLRQHPHPVF